MRIPKLSMKRVIWDQFGAMRQERLLPEQQEMICNKSQQNTRWKLIALYFVIRACFTKWKQLPRSLVCVRTSVDVFHNLCDLSIFIQGHTGSWLVWLVNVSERCWPEHLSHQRCGLFCRRGCLTFQQLLFSDSSWQPSLSHFHTHITSHNLLTWYVNQDHWFSVHREFCVYSSSFFFLYKGETDFNVLKMITIKSKEKKSISWFQDS